MASFSKICPPAVALTRYDTASLPGYVQRSVPNPAMATYFTSFIDIRALTVPLAEADIVKIMDEKGTIQNYGIRASRAEDTYATAQRIAIFLLCALADHGVGGNMSHLPTAITPQALREAGFDCPPGFLLVALYPNFLSSIRSRTLEELRDRYHAFQNDARFYLRKLLTMLERQTQYGFSSAYNMGACFGMNKAAYLEKIAPWLVAREAARRGLSVQDLLRSYSPDGSGSKAARCVPEPVEGDQWASWTAGHGALGLPYTVRIAEDDVREEDLERGDIRASDLALFAARDVIQTVFNFA